MLSRFDNWLAVDVALLSSVPAALLTVYVLPQSVRRSLALMYTDPTSVTAYTSHFVHLTPGHLIGNLGMYLLVAPVLYLLARIRGAETEFRVTFVATLVGLPFVLSALNVALIRPRVGYGFSGIVAGLFGLLSVTLFEYVRAGLRVEISRWWASLPFFVDLTLIGIAMALRAPRAWIGVLCAATVVVVYTEQLRRRLAGTDRLWRRWILDRGAAELAIAGCVLVVVFPVIAFPASDVGDGTILNLYAHFLGFSLTAIAAYVRPPIVGATDRRRTNEDSSGTGRLPEPTR